MVVNPGGMIANPGPDMTIAIGHYSLLLSGFMQHWFSNSVTGTDAGQGQSSHHWAATRAEDQVAYIQH